MWSYHHHGNNNNMADLLLFLLLRVRVRDSNILDFHLTACVISGKIDGGYLSTTLGVQDGYGSLISAHPQEIIQNGEAGTGNPG